MGLRPGKPRAARCAVPTLRALTPSVLGLARKPREPGLRASVARFAASSAAVGSVLGPSRALHLRPCARVAPRALTPLRCVRCRAPRRQLRAGQGPRRASRCFLFPARPPPPLRGSPANARHAACLMRASRASGPPRVRPRVSFVARRRIKYVTRQSHLGVGLSRGYILCPRFSVFQERQRQKGWVRS